MGAESLFDPDEDTVVPPWTSNYSSPPDSEGRKIKKNNPFKGQMYPNFSFMAPSMHTAKARTLNTLFRAKHLGVASCNPADTIETLGLRSHADPDSTITAAGFEKLGESLTRAHETSITLQNELVKEMKHSKNLDKELKDSLSKLSDTKDQLEKKDWYIKSLERELEESRKVGSPSVLEEFFGVRDLNSLPREAREELFSMLS